MKVKIALAGNPNSGKTTLFNALTGSNQFVGNWPGVTVEKKEGRLKGHKDVVIMDLPGIYSLSPYTLEEVVARNYLITERPDVVLNIVDGTNLERNLYLTTQLLELGIPIVVAVNMADLVAKNGDQIHPDELAKRLGCEVVEISALKGSGVTKAAEKAVALATTKAAATKTVSYGKELEEAISSVSAKLSGVDETQKRFFAIKLLERDDKIAANMTNVPEVAADIEKLEKAMDDDAESIITNERYTYISSIIGDCMTKAHGKEKMTTSDRIDRIVTNRVLALPIFALVMFIVYYVSVSTVGAFVTDWTNDVLFGEIIPPAIEAGLQAIGCADWLQGLILDGIVAGVGAVLGFVPQMLVLFLFLAFLEGCGYMARIAFIMDRIFRKYSLRRQAANHCHDRRSIFWQFRMGSVECVDDRDRGNCMFRYHFKKDKNVCGGSCAFRYGTARLSFSDCWKCASFHVGTRLVLYQKGRHNHSLIDDCSVVFDELWLDRWSIHDAGSGAVGCKYSG